MSDPSPHDNWWRTLKPRVNEVNARRTRDEDQHDVSQGSCLLGHWTRLFGVSADSCTNARPDNRIDHAAGFGEWYVGEHFEHPNEARGGVATTWWQKALRHFPASPDRPHPMASKDERPVMEWATGTADGARNWRNQESPKTVCRPPLLRRRSGSHVFVDLIREKQTYSQWIGGHGDGMVTACITP